GGDVEEVVAGEDDDAAGLGDAGRLQVLAPPAVAADEADAAQPRVVAATGGVDDDDGQVGRQQVFQHAPADAAEAAQDDGLFHHATRGVALWEVPRRDSVDETCPISDASPQGA